jgi:hypothetical protein
MRDLFSRTLQTTIIFLIVGGVLALALGGYFSSASNVFTGSLINLQSWFSSRFAAPAEYRTGGRRIQATGSGHSIAAGSW